MCICRVVKCLALSVTGFEQICARWRAVVVTYNKSTDCANMSKAVRLKCSTGVGYGYLCHKKHIAATEYPSLIYFRPVPTATATPETAFPHPRILFFIYAQDNSFPFTAKTVSGLIFDV